MTVRAKTRCWLCDSKDIEPDARGMRCTSCGATFSLLPKPGAEPFKGQGRFESKKGVRSDL